MSPSKETVCGLSLALSLTETEPKDCSSPHRTIMVQDFPDRGPALQLFVLEKCRRFLARDLASAWDWCRTLSNVQKTSHRHGRQVADSRQLGFSKKLVNRHLIPEWQATCEMGMFQQLLTTLLC